MAVGIQDCNSITNFGGKLFFFLRGEGCKGYSLRAVTALYREDPTPPEASFIM
jgi:hypothetical protein